MRAISPHLSYIDISYTYYLYGHQMNVLNDARKGCLKMNKKLYLFNGSQDEWYDTSIIFASSFDEAIKKYGDLRQNHMIAEYIYGYGRFYYDDDTYEEITERNENFSSIWYLKDEDIDEEYETDGVTFRRYIPAGSIWTGDLSIDIYEIPVIDENLILFGSPCSHTDKIYTMKTLREKAEEELRRLEELGDYDERMKAQQVQHQISDEYFRLNDLINERRKYLNQMLNTPSNSKQYKEAYENAERLKNTILKEMQEDDALLTDFKEGETHNESKNNNT